MILINIKIITNQPLTHLEVDIRCFEKNAEVDSVVAALEVHAKKIQAFTNGKTVFVSPVQVLYFETVDKKTFAYLADSIVETRLHLYELTDPAFYNGYIKISKTMVLNVFRIKNVLKLFNGNLDITLDNSEHVFVSRRFVKDFNGFIHMNVK